MSFESRITMTRLMILAAFAGLGALVLPATGLVDRAYAERRHVQRGESAEPASARRPAGTPLLAVVSLRQQRVTIYDAEGPILYAPVSTGQPGYETPAGVFSVLEKEAEHYSNLYDDASMPFMHRITWSGIALHAGPLPGHPASHGCIRMPYQFAEQLFEVTKTGLRVIIAPDDMHPVDISHPALFKPGPVRSQLAEASAQGPSAAGADPVQRVEFSEPTATTPSKTWRAIVAERMAVAEAAAGKVAELRQATLKANIEATKAARAVRAAENALAKAHARLRFADRAVEAAKADVSPDTKIADAGAEGLEQAQAALAELKAQAELKTAAAAALREQLKAAEAVRLAAVNEAKGAEAKLAPVSVFISRKTQRLYVRQSFAPVFESAVEISNPDAPIGTTVFTARRYTQDGADVRWIALGMYPRQTTGDAPGHDRGQTRRHAAALTDVAAAKAALERIAIPEDARERVNELISPGSSLIVSDEAASKETGKATDFVVVMSGEPQGGLKIRRRSPTSNYDGFYRRTPNPYYRNPYYWW
jgi:hypothetical protein